jgi:multidrug resistance efflux pump
MATEAATIEAARTRIQRLVEQIAALSKAEISSEEFFGKFLERVTQATDAKGGAVWLVGSRAQDNKSEFQLCAHTDFASSLFGSDEAQRTVILKILTDVVRSQNAVILNPTHTEATDVAPPPGGSANKTPYAFLHVPLHLNGQPIGVLQVWLQPYVQSRNFAEFVTFLSTLTPYVEQHLQSRRLSNLVLETQRLQHLLRFTSDLAGSLDCLEVARLTANYGRDLAGCERTSVLIREGETWKVLAISGQETVEPKSSMVKAMAAFVEAHIAQETRILDKKELLERAEAVKGGDSAPALVTARTDEIDILYFQLSHVVSAVICPMLNDEKEITGAIFCESTFEAYFDTAGGKSEVLPARRVTEWVAVFSGRTLAAARDYQTLPFLPVSQRVRGTRLLLTGKKRNRVLLKAGTFAVVALVALLYPAHRHVDGDCTVQALSRAIVVPQVTAQLETVKVHEGDHVAKGQVIALLDTRRLKLDLDGTEQEMLRYNADADRLRAAGDEAGAQVSLLEVKVLEQQAKKIQADIDSATLRSPIDGIVMTKDLELRAGEVLQQGAPFAEIDDLSAWQLHAEINERDIAPVEEALQNSLHPQAPPASQAGAAKPEPGLPLTYILYSQSAHVLHARIDSRQEISATAYPRDKDNVFLVTIDNPPIPPEIIKDIRPGLTGRAKIDLGREALIVTIARKFYRWCQFKMVS